MDSLLIYRIAAILIIAFIYMIFDVFNKRNVPSIFAYASLIIGIIFTLSYYPDTHTMLISTGIAVVIASVGYVFYRAGQLGAADVIELAAISLMLPIQPAPYLVSYTQFGLPFIISVFIAAGVIALVMIPFYYLPRARAMLKKNLFRLITKGDMYKGFLLLAAYILFTGFMVYQLSVGIIGVTLMIIIMVSSMITAVFERPITDSMIEYIPIEKFEDGDIIATNVMKKSEINRIREKMKGFDRLVTQKTIAQMKKLKVKDKFPVYRQAMPLALPIFLGVVVSILFGNLMIVII
ncbi:MAG: hypothetical protein ACHQX1_02635 [Candidatus Micrarchaeales archaeon]